MKKTLSLILACLLLFSLAACGAKEEAPAPAEAAPAAVEPVTDLSVPPFYVKVCGVKLTEADMADCALYRFTAETVNSSGTAKTTEYVGYRLSDVFAKAGFSGSYSKVKVICADGYEMDFEGDLMTGNCLLALYKNGEACVDSGWFAPCASGTTGDYAQNAVKLELDGVEAPAAKEEKAEEKAEETLTELKEPLAEDKTGKIVFGDFCFRVNGQDVTNAELEGLSVYRITVTVQNSKGLISEVKYSGYVLSEVLAKLGIENPASVKAVASDGYESELSPENIQSELTIIAIEKDKAVSEDGSVWLAPCMETSSGKYGKGIVDIFAE